MSIADTQRVKDLERVVAALEARVLLLEMQKQPVQAIGGHVHQDKRNTLSLRKQAA